MTAIPIDPALAAWLEDALEREGKILGKGYQATIRQLSSPWGELVVKSPHTGMILARLGRRAIRRECRVYEQIGAMEGIPHCYGLAAGEHLVLQQIVGPPLRELELQLQDRERFFARLLDIIQALHQLGIAHGDLKRKDNILVGPGEVPFLIDFGIAATLPGDSGRFKRLWFDFVRQMDLNAWIKLKHGRRPEQLPEADAALYQDLLIERLARWIRIPWQVITLRRPRQRWRKRKSKRS